MRCQALQEASAELQGILSRLLTLGELEDAAVAEQAAPAVVTAGEDMSDAVAAVAGQQVDLAPTLDDALAASSSSPLTPTLDAGDALTEAAPDLQGASSSLVESASDLVDAASAAAPAVVEAPARYDGFLSPLSDALESVLGVLQHGLEFLHVPYSYGFSIILLTVFVRTATFPLTKKQAEVSMAAMQLKPTIDRIKRRYGDDKDRINRETARLYEMTKINPLAGCLPSLASIPIFLGLYYSLGNVANEGVLENEGFFWIPSLAGPTSLALRKSGAGTAWLFPFEDGHPPIGWEDAGAYLVLPVALVGIQYLLSALISPPKDPEAEENETLQTITKLLPLMLGWFSLNVPAGLTLYYFSNVSLVSAQQIYLRKLGGAKVDLGIELPEEKYGVGRRRTNKEGVLVEGAATLESDVVLVDDAAVEEVMEVEAAAETEAGEAVMAAAVEEESIDRRCKRKRLVPAPGSAMAMMQKGMIPLDAAETGSA